MHTPSHRSTRPVTVTDATFPFAVLRADRPVLVDFTASWCGSCQRLLPVLEELAAEYADRVGVAKVDVDRNMATAERHGVRGLPSLVLFVDGQERWRLVNVLRKAAIAAELDASLAELDAAA